jgi:mono/diheme cytochrome c family protein
MPARGLLLIKCARAAAGVVLAGVLVVAAAPPGRAEAQGPADAVARGRYIFGAAAGCGCHTETKKGALLNAGGRKYEGAFGTVYATNITPDRQTGIGSWTDDQIIAAIRLGRRPNGERLVPVHPYTVFNGMAESDLRVLVAYLRSVPAVNRPNTPRRLVPLFESIFLPAWLATFASREVSPAAVPTTGLARGEYLVRAVTHCGECHTPRGLTQAVDNTRFLAGNPSHPEGKMPNITPDKATGIGDWSDEEIADFLASGTKPDGDVAGDLMGEVIQGTSAGYKDLTKADRLAIARYVKSIPPIRNKIGK